MCYGPEHVFAWVPLYAGEPPEDGLTCRCGGVVYNARSGVFVAAETMPTGLCPKCNRPLDDHTWDAKGPLCPAKVAT